MNTYNAQPDTRLRYRMGLRTFWLSPACQPRPETDFLSAPERSSTLPAFAFTSLYVLLLSIIVVLGVLSISGAGLCMKAKSLGPVNKPEPHPPATPV